MKERRFCACLLVALAIMAMAGCSRDPNVRKQKYMESGKGYVANGKYAEAAIQFANAVKLDPAFAEGHYQLAQAYLKMGNGNGAYAELVRTIDLQPDNLTAQLDLGNLFFLAKDYKRALEQAEMVLAKQAQNPDALLLKSTALGSQGDQAGAFAALRHAIALAPDRAVLFMNLAIVQSNMNDLAGAEQSLKKAAELDPKSSAIHLSLARLYERQHRAAEAEVQFKKAVEVSPDSAEVRRELASFYFRQGRMEAVDRVATQAKQDLPKDSAAYRMKGDFYIASGDIDKALAEYSSLHQAHQDDLQVARNYVSLLLMKGRVDEANTLNEDILKKNPKEVEGSLAKGQILIARSEFTDAVSLLESAIKMEPDNAWAHLLLGKAFAGVGKLDRAETEWGQAVRLRPSLSEAQVLRAETALKKKDAGTLRHAADALIEYSPKSPSGYLYRAVASYWQGQLKGVEPDLQKAIELAPQDPAPVTRLADWRQENRRFAEAEKLYAHALELDATYFRAVQGLVTLYQTQKQVPRALQLLDAQLAKVPNSSAYHQIKGSLLASNRDWAGAATELEKALEVDQKNNQAAILLAQVQAELGQPNKAASEYERVIQRNPRDARAYFMLGTQYEQAGNWQKAQQMYRKVLEIRPEHPLAANNLAWSMLEHGGNVDVALSLAQIARRGEPDLPPVADTLALAYYKRGAYKSAIDLLEEAIKKAPDAAHYHYHLGLCYTAIKDQGRARAEFERALQLDAKSPQAAEVRKAIALLK